VIHVRAMTKAYGPVPALRDVDLDVYPGECVAVLGPNGAGKTTMIEILEGFRAADSGTVRVLGKNPSRAGAAWRERIGVVYQNSGPLPSQTVWEVVNHWAGFYRAGRDPAEVITTVGLEHKAEARVSSLSGGLRRRLEFALAIIGRPQLLFLDEPTAGLDPVSRRSSWELIRRMKHAGTTVLLCTHYLDEAAQLADRLVVMVAGRVVAVDTPDRLSGDHHGESAVRWREDGQVREARTSDPATFIAELTRRLGGLIDGLEVLRPTLEDAYVVLLGHVSGASGRLARQQDGVRAAVGDPAGEARQAGHGDSPGGGGDR
jgi:ABC-2 type transport system ATP-binding protein